MSRPSGHDRAQVGAPTGANVVLEALRERIAAGGPLTFEAYMRLALYHPVGGYYASRVPGQMGDYATSPSLTPWFGRLVVRDLQAMWDSLGRPDTFTVTEVGAGRADLAAAALASAGPLAQALRWRIVERFAGVQELQSERLGSLGEKVTWLSSLADQAAPVDAGCVLAHEVLDNFPVHLLEVAPDGEPREVYLDWEGPRLAQRLGPVSIGIEAEARDAARHLAAGRRFEVCGDLPSWCAEVASTLRRGFVLAIDYGDLKEALWRDNPDGTVVTYGPDGFGEDPLVDPGRNDITADVNFSALERELASQGFRRQLFCTQRDWLGSLGVEEVQEDLEAQARYAWDESRTADALRLEEEVSLLGALLARLGLGDIMVFRAARP